MPIMVFSECDMKTFQYIQLIFAGKTARLILDREQKHNSLFPPMTEELREAIRQLKEMDEVHFVVLSGNGQSFCSGADIAWFSESVNKSRSENWEEYLQFAQLLKELYELPQITIAAVHKNVLGGGNGIMAACDFVVAERSTAFAFSEVRLGLIPATIIPFIANRLSVQNMKKLFYSAERFWASEAHIIGLVDFIAEDGRLNESVEKLIADFKKLSPNALKTCKQMVQKTASGEINIDSGEYTSAVLADLIQSPEGQEGINAFLEKRKPDWTTVKVENE